MINFGDQEEDSPAQGEEKRQGEPANEPLSSNRDDPAYLPRFEALEPEEGGPEPPSYESEPASGEGMLAPTEPQSAIPEGRREEARRRVVPRWLWELVEIALLAILIFLAVRTSFQNFRVEGMSMEPSLQGGQYLIVNKLAYATIDLSIFDWLPFYDAGEDSVHHIFGSPGRGDVVVFQAPRNPQQDFIKRIIGVPGDAVVIEEGKVILNGELLSETYASGATLCSGECQWTVPEGHYFVLGDNREHSSDSRAFGFVPEGNMVGKTLFSYWPLDEAGLAPNQSVSYATDEE